MFKNPKAIYFLIPIVLAIWGVIFYKIYTNRSKDNGISLTTQEIKYTDDVVLDTNKEEHLSLNYADPFLRKIGAQKNNFNAGHVAAQQKKDVGSNKVLFKLNYLGYIKNKQAKKSYFLLSKNGEVLYLAFKKNTNGFELIKSYTDSILVKNLNQYYMVFKDSSKIYTPHK